MIAISLQSGSDGNAFYVESHGVRLLFDAGICAREAERRLADYGRDIRSVQAVVVSHDHADHIRHAGSYQRTFGLPLYVTSGTLRTAGGTDAFARLDEVRPFNAGGILRFGEVVVQTVPTPHDGSEGAAFVVTAAKRRLGILTDLGHAFKALDEIMPNLDAVFIESNYDPEMLTKGPYPRWLKERIRGPEGHLSNQEAAELLSAGRKLQWACLIHLSGKNNSPCCALRTHRMIVPSGLPLYAASRHAPTGIFRVHPSSKPMTNASLSLFP